MFGKAAWLNYTRREMRRYRFFLFAFAFLFLPARSFPSAYNGRPKLVVVIVVDQFRGDYLERYRDQFSGGFRMLLDGGANFTDCYYDYAQTRTAPGTARRETGQSGMGQATG